MDYRVELNFLKNESDVEQKVVLPLLKTNEPAGLGYNDININTKLNLRKLPIEKRSNAKLYYPDYVVLTEGIPFIVVEVKKPNEDLVEAYREARLYALEINALYEKGINPCNLIFATDGLNLLAGVWDSSEPIFNIPIENWSISNNEFGEFVLMFGLRKTRELAREVRNKLRTSVVYKKPINLLGGKYIQNQQIKNTFGETISLQYRHLFNPTNEYERADIVKNAYVKVQKHLSHVTPIDRLIRKKVLPSAYESNEIRDNTVPIEIEDKLRNASDYNNQVLLLIGSVGSGKTTFTSYLKEVGLKKDINEKLLWIRLDLNEAPVAANEIYKWIKKQINKELELTMPKYNAKKIDSIKEIFSKEIEEFNLVALELFDEESDSYKEKLFIKIQELKADLDKTLAAYIDFFAKRHGKELIIILDNCDKRNLEEQLLMFEVANYLKENTKSIVFLPLRETTFDHFRHQKPLDTVVKDLIFRINPPSLQKVIYNRIKYSIRISKTSKENSYHLENGIRVSYPSADELFYLKSILKSLFQNNFFKRLLTGLTGRDIRKGIEIFLDFCKSGHISESHILKMKQSKGEYSLPNHIISKVFIRGNRLYYSDLDTRVKNLFSSDPSDELPDPFARVSILLWLKHHDKRKGPSGITGFHKVSTLLQDLLVLGHSESRILEELKFLIKNSLVMSESQEVQHIELSELISINTPGVVHLNLLTNVDYLSSCAEDVWFNVEETATKIANRISGKSRFAHFSLQTAFSNSNDLLDYLEKIGLNYFSVQSKIISDRKYKLPLDFNGIKDTIELFGNSAGIKKYKELEIGINIKARVVNIFAYGLICELENTSQTGFVSVRSLSTDPLNFDINQELFVKILNFNQKHNKYDVEIVANE